jgi:kynureninase
VLFREHDLKLLKKLAPLAGEEERYILATRDSRETMEKLLAAEMTRLADEDDAEVAAEAAEAAAQRRVEAGKQPV